MAIIFQALIGLALLIGLVGIFLSSKNWHWTQVVLVTLVFFCSFGTLYMAVKTVNKHKQVRARIPRLETDLENMLKRNEQLVKGQGDEPGIRELDHRLEIKIRERGRVWREVTPTGQMDDQGRVEVEIPNPQPHGIEQDTILYAFEMGPPNPMRPEEGAQYLGEFRVVSVTETGATLEPMHLLTQRTGERLSSSQGPWSLYESMPFDQHKLFAQMPEEQLMQLISPGTIEEYIRHGGPATPDDDDWSVIGFDENEQQLGPNELANAVKKLFNRPIRDFAYLFGELAEQRVVLLTNIRSVTADNEKQTVALKSAEELGEFRKDEIAALEKNLEGMKLDREAIESHLATLQTMLRNAKSAMDATLAENSSYANKLTDMQLGLLRYINSNSPQPAGKGFTSP